MTAGDVTSLPVDVSVIVPVVERPEPLAALYEEFAPALREAGYRFEFVFAAHQWYDYLLAPLKPLVERGEPIRVMTFGQGVSETSILKVTAAGCRGRVILTLPAYRQVVPSALPALVEAVEDGADFAVARRWPRKDSIVNRLQNRVLHAAIGNLGGGKLRDVACGVRAARPKVVEDARVYGDFVRFFPLIALREGFSVVEVECPLHPAAMGGRVYGPGVYLRRLIDILGLTFLMRFTDKPLRFFGLIGGVLALAGGVILAVLLFQRQVQDTAVSDRPILLLGVLLLTLGVQAIALGLIGEMIVHLHASRRPLYRLREREERERRARPRISSPGEPAPVPAHGPEIVPDASTPAPHPGHGTIAAFGTPRA
jgi:hypothetical protein